MLVVTSAAYAPFAEEKATACYLYLKGKRKFEKEVKEENYHRVERSTHQEVAAPQGAATLFQVSEIEGELKSHAAN